MRLKPKGVVGAVLLAFAMGGAIYLSGVSHAQELDALEATLASSDPSAPAVGPVRVSRGLCRYFYPPDPAQRALDRLGCPSCVTRAEQVRERFTPSLVERECARRGSNNIVFARK